MHGDFISAVAGIAVHLSLFHRGEHHMYGVRYVQCALSIFILAVLGLVGAGYSLDQAFFLTTRYGGSFFAGLYGSLLAYRSVFSPLNRFPGPWSAKFSTLSLSAQVWRGDAHTRILRLHQQFGDFVRVGSSDLSIIHPQAVSAIYGRGSPCMKAAWYEMAAPLVSMQSTRNRQEHDARRRIWAPAFTDTMVRSYEERLATYQDQLIEHILDLGSRPVDVSHLFDLYSYDVMGDLGSGTSFNMLKSDQHHSTIEQYRKAIISLSWNLPVWVLRLLLAVSGPTGKDWFPGVTYSCERRDERMKIKPASRDIMSFLLDPWVDRTLSSSDMNMLHGDSQLIIVAGSDTTSATLVCALHELTKFPNGIPQLRTEIESLLQSGKTISNQNLHSLAFLNGVINETLRLYPPAGMLQRLTPPEGLDIGGTHIPGNTTVFCPFYALGRSDAIYVRPEEFCPQRWYEYPEMIKYKSAFAPFSTGTYNCIGKSVAMMNLRTTLAKLILKFDINVHDAGQFAKGMRTGFTMIPGALWVRFREREKRGGV